MKRHLLFAGDNCYPSYPSGGANDFVGAYDTEAGAREAVPRDDVREKLFRLSPFIYDWAHVAFLSDNGSLGIVAEFTREQGWHLP